MQQEGEEELSIEELASNLSTYKEQLQQVKKLLINEPGNDEYRDMERELEEVIGLTEELLSSAKQSELNQFGADGDYENQRMGQTSSIHMESHDIPGDHDAFAVGSLVQAVWSEDGEWYDATVQAITSNGYYVSYDSWGNKEEVDPENVRARPEGPVDTLKEAEKQAEATKLAIKRKIAQAAGTDLSSRTLPAKLQIDPNDPEDVKAAKKKKIHAFKSKVRLVQLEVTQNKRQNAWQQFQTAKGQSKKVGFFSGRKKESIFKSPDDPKGKVGVTGSGKGLTEFQKREKFLHLKGSAGDAEE